MSFLADYNKLTTDAERAKLVNTMLATQHVALFAELRDTKPIFLSPGTAIVTKARDVAEVLAQNEVFSVCIYAPRMERLSGAFILGMDAGPQYERDVSILRLAARRSDLETVKFIVERTATACIQKVLASGKLDAVGDLTRVVSAQLVVEYFGVPGPDLATLQRWMRALFWDIFLNLTDAPAVRAAADAASAELKTYLTALIAQRRSELKAGTAKTDDVLTRLVEMSDEPLTTMTDADIIRNLSGLIIGTVDTTSQAVSQAVDQLLNRPDQLAAACALAQAGDTAKLSKYVFEALRFNPQNPYIYRVNIKDYVLAKGTPRETLIPAGSFVAAGTSSAMFDADAVPQPDEFHVDRSWGEYMFYGSGMHECFGRYINAISIPGIAQALLSLKGLRRAAGDAGKLQYEGPFPNAMQLEFDPQTVTLPVPPNEADLPILLTFAPSLDCETTRWMLKRYQVAYKEEAHSLATMPAAMAALGTNTFPALGLPGNTLSTVAGIRTYYEAHVAENLKLVPAATPDLGDITLNWIYGIGVNSTLWGYFNLLPLRDVMITAFQKGLPESEAAIVALKYSDIAAYMGAGLKCTPENAQAALAAGNAGMDKLDAILSDGRKFMTGGRFSIFDIYVGVQLSPFVFPANYGGSLPPYEALTAEMKKVIDATRARPTGKFILRMYREER